MYNYEEILAIVPVYDKDFGNVSKLILKDDELLLRKKLDSFLNSLCKKYFVDLKYMKKNYGKFLGVRNLPPINIGKKVFIPLKTREPRIKNDGSIGYIDLASIEKIEKKNSHTQLVLTNKKTIKVYSNYYTVIRHINNGRLIESYKLKEKSSLADFLVTKEDLRILEAKLDYILNIIKE